MHRIWKRSQERGPIRRTGRLGCLKRPCSCQRGIGQFSPSPLQAAPARSSPAQIRQSRQAARRDRPCATQTAPDLEIPCRRAVADTSRGAERLSSTIRSFVASDQRRGRPVSTTSRRLMCRVSVRLYIPTVSYPLAWTRPTQLALWSFAVAAWRWLDGARADLSRPLSGLRFLWRPRGGRRADQCQPQRCRPGLHCPLRFDDCRRRILGVAGRPLSGSRVLDHLPAVTHRTKHGCEKCVFVKNGASAEGPRSSRIPLVR
jgi:hypothetical protein